MPLINYYFILYGFFFYPFRLLNLNWTIGLHGSLPIVEDKGNEMVKEKEQNERMEMMVGIQLGCAIDAGGWGWKGREAEGTGNGMYRYIQGQTDQIRGADGVIGRKKDGRVECDKEIRVK